VGTNRNLLFDWINLRLARATAKSPFGLDGNRVVIAGDQNPNQLWSDLSIHLLALAATGIKSDFAQYFVWR